MNDDVLDELVRRSAPVSDSEIARLALTAPLDELREAIMSTIPTEPLALPAEDLDHPGVPLRSGVTSPRRWRRLVAIAAVAAASVTAISVVDLPGRSGPSSSAWAAPLVEFAERSPLLLIDDPAWTVERADEYGEEGEMTFVTGGLQAELFWRNGPLSEWLEDRLANGIDLGSHPVANGTATLVQYRGTDDYVALWEASGRVLEFRALAEDADEFTSLIDALEVVSVDRWLAAMPASVIKAADQPATITEMLEGVPLPPGFDPASIANDSAVKDRYQVGAQVVSAVSCAWIERWLDAKARGDIPAAQAAVEAMNTSSGWPVIEEMNRTGAYGQILQVYVTAMANDTNVDGGRPATISESYENALGCAN